MNEENELDSTCGVSDKEMTYRFQQGVNIENEIKQLKGLPIAGYDLEKLKSFPLISMLMM